MALSGAKSGIFCLILLTFQISSSFANLKLENGDIKEPPIMTVVSTFFLMGDQSRQKKSISHNK
jgi:hypothetical protein